MSSVCNPLVMPTIPRTAIVLVAKKLKYLNQNNMPRLITIAIVSNTLRRLEDSLE